MHTQTFRQRRHLVAVLDNIRSLYNVGSMFRTADAFGVEHLYLCGMTGQPDDILVKDRVAKTALGAELTVPWTYEQETTDAITHLKNDGYTILALEQTSTAINLYEYSSTRKIAQGGRSGGEAIDRVALIVGHEVDGISQSVLALADAHIQIPMLGQKESLNVSVAFGIALSHLGQQL